MYEVVIRVSDLDRAERFYQDVLGLKDPNRPMSCWRVAGCECSSCSDDGEWPKQHFASPVEEAYLEDAEKLLEEQGVSTQGPLHHEWMPAKLLYFADPDAQSWSSALRSRAAAVALLHCRRIPA